MLTERKTCSRRDFLKIAATISAGWLFGGGVAAERITPDEARTKPRSTRNELEIELIPYSTIEEENRTSPIAGYGKTDKGEYFFKTKAGETVNIPPLPGLDIEIQTGRGLVLLVYFANHNPVGILNPNPYYSENTPKAERKPFRIVLESAVLAEMQSKRQLPEGILFSPFPTPYTVKEFVDNNVPVPQPR